MRDLDQRFRTSTGRPATVSAAEFPISLPPSPRSLGGGFPVEEARARLLRLLHGQLGLMRVLAGWVVEIPEFEAKVELGHHIYLLSEAALRTRARLLELRANRAVVDEWKDADQQVLWQELLLARDPAEFLAGTHLAAAWGLQAAVRAYLACTDNLLDLPTVRVLQGIDRDLDPIVAWGNRAVRAYVDSGTVRDPTPWKDHCVALLTSLGAFGDGARGVLPPVLRQADAAPFRRRVGCQRDGRFETFSNTRSYLDAPQRSSRVLGEYEAKRLELIRVQRDEIDAIETFANVLFDLSAAPFDLQMDLARFIWDEARHAEIGHQALRRLGYEPFEMPCSIIGINVRSPLAPEVALAQISVFGELSIVGPMRQLSDQAYRLDDRETGLTFDYIHADEILHLRRGRKWLEALSEDGNLSTLQERARSEAVRRLVEEGVLREDYESALSASQISDLLGGGG